MSHNTYFTTYYLKERYIMSIHKPSPARPSRPSFFGFSQFFQPLFSCLFLTFVNGKQNFSRRRLTQLNNYPFSSFYFSRTKPELKPPSLRSTLEILIGPKTFSGRDGLFVQAAISLVEQYTVFGGQTQLIPTLTDMLQAQTRLSSYRNMAISVVMVLPSAVQYGRGERVIRYPLPLDNST